MSEKSSRGSKALFYLFFCALGLFGGEGLSTNAPQAVFLPPFYLVYGLLYVLLVDSLLRSRVDSWMSVYLYGTIVGYATEAFVAKVMFFGWPDNKINLWGVVPLPEMPLLTFFFHPLFSFIVPVVLSIRFLRFPFALKLNRWTEALLYSLPVVFFFQVTVTGVRPAIVLIMVDVAVLVLLAFALRSKGGCQDVLLTRSQRGWTAALLFAIYMAAFLLARPYHRAVYMPVSLFQTAFACLFVLFLGLVASRNLPKKAGPGKIAYSPDSVDTKAIGRGGLYFVFMVIAGLIVFSRFAIPAKSLWCLVFLTGTFSGVVVFIIGVYRAFFRKEAAGHPVAGRENVLLS